MNKITGLAFVIMAVFLGPLNSQSVLAEPPPLAPLGEPPIPPDNKQTDAKVELGKILFFDPRLGGDTSTACATCHEPDAGWAWADDFSRGYPGTVHWRNSQSIVNSAYYGKFFWAGAAPSLEMQAPAAAKGGVAGNGEDDLMEARLCLIPEYRKRFKDVFGDEWPLIGNAWRAIAAFERTLVQRDTPLDQYLQGDKEALTEKQIRGMELFNGKANCIACHNGPFASDQRYYNIGVPSAKRWEEDGLAQITFRFEYYAKGAAEKLYRSAKADAGLYFRTKNEWDKGKFRTPTLRYTQYTAPYMHNGAFYTLEEVVDFYNRGGFAEPEDGEDEDEDEDADEDEDEDEDADEEGDEEGDEDGDEGGDEEADEGSDEVKVGRTTDWPQNKTPLIQPLGLTDDEKEDLLAFIKAFSGDEITIERPELPDYAPLFTEEELQALKK
ncbi:MAG: cytochrome-c peroxidase [Candidatus Parabeggiatoa sp. nov. 3]|nr:MAG: cytochrome-c peroxidase [Gammaproteobacteria bacterium]RKZ55788.1 MAG: cytochrome-c peroxidase [Gammaproteobacteria bacterium]RKZ77469.1 MAG: cytochrome-c peroxidase [Gammaproteobacteria bacterium]